MIRRFFPTATSPSVFDIDYEKLWLGGFRGLIFDIDMTLVPHGADSTPEVEALFERLHRLGFQTLLLSNNDEERVRRFLRRIDSLFLCDAGKPDPASYHQAVRNLGLLPSQVLMIGDQLFTDIQGANLAGLRSILVDYILWPGEKKSGLRRRAESILLFFYRLFPRQSLYE